MVFDQFSLMAAIGFSSTALSLTLFMTWIGSLADRFLLSWSVGMAAIVVGVVLFSIIGEPFDPLLQLGSFWLLIAGFALVYAGALQFCLGSANWPLVAAMTGGSLFATSLPFLFGLSGIGTVMGNLGIAVLVGLTARHYWAGRREALLPMLANTALYGAASLSFVLCALALTLQGDAVLTARPSNWAEDINSIVMIICVTGIGAVSLALHQFRIARRHKRDAMTDGLTGLLNRRALFEHYEQAPTNGGLGLLVMDLDHFKAINDGFGHAGGDLVLQHFAEVISTELRPNDRAAQLGGEEFCAALPAITAKEARKIAERIRAALEAEPVLTEKGEARATVSVGVAISVPGESFETALGRADAALYVAKQEGRNRVHSSGLKRVA